jgi:UDP-N-acetylmuramate--alanine ligase
VVSMPVVLAEPDPSWRVLFEEERTRIAAALGVAACAIEHVGSTAVPGLPAKPVVDAVVGLDGDLDADRLATSLSRLDYERRPEGDFPGRLFFVRPARGSEPRWHLSVCVRGGACWRDQLAFRDALRLGGDLARRYGELKRELAGGRADDRLAYPRAKAGFVREALAAGDASAAGPLAGRRLWFAGIGGAGMSALAIVARDWGAEVSGWDRVHTPYLDPLGGVEVALSPEPPEPPRGWEVVVSTAFAGKLRGRSRGELLAELVSLRPSIVVAGAHGKTTTTAMIAFCLDRLGLDPTFLVGGPVPQLGANARAGEGWLVAEGDESDRSLELLRPEIGVLTNVDLDHHSTFASRREVVELFERWLEHCPRQVRGEELEPVSLELAVPGEHNRRNAAAALAALELAGVARADAERALVEFAGAGRRLERRGEARGVWVYDDYAHHPAEISATLAAARSLGSGARLVVLFQPHLYSRTRHLAHELAAALATADAVVVTDVYAAREEPVEGVTGKLVVDALAELRPGSSTGWAPRLEDAATMTARRARAGDVVLTIGAGDVDRAAGLILDAIREG